jgi:hypothetical protein
MSSGVSLTIGRIQESSLVGIEYPGTVNRAFASGQ